MNWLKKLWQWVFGPTAHPGGSEQIQLSATGPLPGEDIHAATAAELGVDRQTAKIINYARMYGGGEKPRPAAVVPPPPPSPPPPDNTLSDLVTGYMIHEIIHSSPPPAPAPEPYTPPPSPPSYDSSSSDSSGAGDWAGGSGDAGSFSSSSDW